MSHRVPCRFGWPNARLVSIQNGMQASRSLIAVLASFSLATSALAREPFSDTTDTSTLRSAAIPVAPADATNALRSALAGGGQLHLPAGDYRLTDSITLASGQRLIGDGVTATRLLIGPDFKATASAVVVVAPGDASGIDALGLNFDQRGASDRSSLRRYPWAIDIRNATRFGIGRLRISGAWNGINGQGNAGGLDAGTLELGAFNTGIVLDGLLDFAHINTVHCWVFDFAASQSLKDVYADGQSTCAEFGQVDGLDIKSLTTYMAKVRFNGNGNAVSRQIGQVALDADWSTISVESGNLQIGLLSSTKSVLTSRPTLDVSGGSVVVVSNVRTYGATSQPTLRTRNDGTILNVLGGYIEQRDDHPIALAEGGSLVVNNVYFYPNPYQIRKTPMLSQSGSGVLAANNNLVLPRVNGSGDFIRITKDNVGHHVAGNSFGGWSNSFPSGARMGQYGQK